ncbi:unnamed protein product [Bathycoccus prasinos]
MLTGPEQSSTLVSGAMRKALNETLEELINPACQTSNHRAELYAKCIPSLYRHKADMWRYCTNASTWAQIFSASKLRKICVRCHRETTRSPLSSAGTTGIRGIQECLGHFFHFWHLITVAKSLNAPVFSVESLLLSNSRDEALIRGKSVGTTLDYLSPLKQERFRREACFFPAAKKKGQLKRKGSRTLSYTAAVIMGAFFTLAGLRSLFRSRKSLEVVQVI